MAVLSKEDFMSAIRVRVGEDTSDEALAFVENMSDTFDSLTQAAGDNTDWKTKYDELDNNWRKRYTERFYSAEEAEDEAPSFNERTVKTFDELFK